MRVFTNKRYTFISLQEVDYEIESHELVLYADIVENTNMKALKEFKPWKGSEVVIMYELPNGGYTEDVFDDRLLQEDYKPIKFIRVWDKGIITRLSKITGCIDIQRIGFNNHFFTHNETVYE